MGYMSEYINRKLSAVDLESELLRLIKQYNEHRKTCCIVYAAAINKSVPEIALDQADYYLIHDLLKTVDSPTLDFYIETPGGSGEAAEEIVRCLRAKFEQVAFVVSGEAKSAGTIMVLSGEPILMTETGSLGPIDAQMKIGRSTVSAYDYMDWFNNKQAEAETKGRLNPLDATMVAQISPGELIGVHNALSFAKDLVVEWLVAYKFGNWNFTEIQHHQVSQEMKRERAEQIAADLCNHTLWRSHGRSIKSNDLERIGLKITNIDADPVLSDIVYRIQTVCRLLFSSTTIYKIFATDKEKVFKSATNIGSNLKVPKGAVPEVAELDITCEKCGSKYKLYAKFIDNPKIDGELQNKGAIAFPQSNKLKCKCGYEIDLSGIRNEIETKIGSKII